MVVRKMKEKCKDAARMRREKERVEFVELSKLLPLPSSTTSQLDKASIIRLTSSYLRMRSAFPQGLGENWGTRKHPTHIMNQHHLHQNQTGSTQPQQYSHNNQVSNHHYPEKPVKELGSLIMQTLDGFVFALHRDGKIMYISETASVHLGLPQIDLTGNSIYDYIHTGDHDDIDRILNLDEGDEQFLKSFSGTEQNEVGRSFSMRMKCILPKRNAGLVSSGYKTIHCNGYLKIRYEPIGSDDQEHRWKSYALVAVGHSLLPTASTEIKMSSNSFMFRANLDLKLYYADSQMINLLGYEQADIVDQSMYHLVHVADSNSLEQSHKLLLTKGQAVSKYYRLMRRCGGFIWVQTHATLIYNPRCIPKPQHIVGICFILGGDYIDKSSIYTKKVATSMVESKTQKSPVTNDIDRKITSVIEGKQRKDKYPSSKRMRSTKIDKFIQNPEHLGRYLNSQANCLQNGSLNFNPIGSIRRASDDSCSVVSSIASTNVSSISSHEMSIPSVACYGKATSNKSYCIEPHSDNILQSIHIDTTTTGIDIPHYFEDYVPRFQSTGKILSISEPAPSTTTTIDQELSKHNFWPLSSNRTNLDSEQNQLIKCYQPECFQPLPNNWPSSTISMGLQQHENTYHHQDYPYQTQTNLPIDYGHDVPQMMQDIYATGSDDVQYHCNKAQPAFQYSQQTTYVGNGYQI